MGVGCMYRALYPSWLERGEMHKFLQPVHRCFYYSQVSYVNKKYTNMLLESVLSIHGLFPLRIWEVGKDIIFNTTIIAATKRYHALVNMDRLYFKNTLHNY